MRAYRESILAMRVPNTMRDWSLESLERLRSQLEVTTAVMALFNVPLGLVSTTAAMALSAVGAVLLIVIVGPLARQIARHRSTEEEAVRSRLRHAEELAAQLAIELDEEKARQVRTEAVAGRTAVVVGGLDDRVRRAPEEALERLAKELQDAARSGRL